MADNDASWPSCIERALADERHALKAPYRRECIGELGGVAALHRRFSTLMSRENNAAALVIKRPLGLKRWLEWPI